MTKESPIACDLTALNPDERNRRQALFDALRRRTLRVDDAGEGFAFVFPYNAQSWKDAAEFVTLERRCCPFLEFTLVSAKEDGDTTLIISGRPGVKSFLRHALDLPDLITL